MLAALALTWSAGTVRMAERRPKLAMSLAVAIGDLVVLGAIQLAEPAAYAGVRFVAVLPVLREQLVYEALDAGVAAVLLREELQPTTLVATVRAVAAGNTTLPSDLVPRLLARAAHEAGAGSRVLSDREMAVLRLLSEGNDTCQIGDSLGYSERTVKNIVHDMLMKMNCRNRVHAVALATREGLI